MTSLGDPPLSERLRTATRTEHRAAESEPFVTALLTGALDISAYADLVGQHWAVYSALESVGSRLRHDRRGAGLVFTALDRLPSVERDLTHLHGSRWRTRVELLPATRAYAARVRGTGLPEYAAHAYTRYLGDLSGGQVIRRMLQRHYGMGTEGLAFYTFARISSVRAFKDLYRRRLDSLGLDAGESARAVAEAREAFDLNRAVLSELGARHRCGAAGVVA